VCHIAEEPIYFTKNDYGDLVIMSVEIYEITIKRLNMYRQLELSGNRNDTGKTRDARESLDNLKKKMHKFHYNGKC